jgi:hypothetical protein
VDLWFTKGEGGVKELEKKVGIYIQKGVLSSWGQHKICLVGNLGANEANMDWHMAYACTTVLRNQINN